MFSTTTKEPNQPRHFNQLHQDSVHYNYPRSFHPWNPNNACKRKLWSLQKPLGGCCISETEHILS